MRVWGCGFAASCGGMAKAKKRLGAECRWRTTGETAPRCFEPWSLWGREKKSEKPSSRRLASGQASAFPTGWILGRLLPAELSPSLAKLFLLRSAPALEERKALGRSPSSQGQMRRCLAAMPFPHEGGNGRRRKSRSVSVLGWLGLKGFAYQ